MDSSVVKELIEKINEADMVLIGVGFEYKYDYLKPDDERKKALLDAYRNIIKLVDGKNHYILSLCYDDLIREVADDSVRIVTPCGTRRYMQCDTHLVELKDVISNEGKSICPHCGKEMDYNTIDNPGYLEEGYLEDFGNYKKWLQGTVNKKLLILELGVGMQYPSVIRFAFDKLCMYNLKSYFVRVNETFYQHTAENKGRTVGIKQNSVSFMLENF